MQISDLAKGLTSDKAAVRLKMAQVTGTLDEVALLSRLTDAYKQEGDTKVKKALVWAGKRLKKSQEEGYSTLEALFEHFGINRAIRNTFSNEDARLIDGVGGSLIETNLGGSSGSVNLAGAMFGSVLFGPLGAAMGMNIGKTDPANNLSSTYIPQSSRYELATEPSKEDISRYLRALKSPDRLARSDAIADLYRIKNISAIPYLAIIFIEDEDAAIREQAQNTAKRIYWNSLSWQMHQSGSIQKEIERRVAELNKTKDIDDAIFAPDVNRPRETQEHEDIDAILQKAQAERDKRRRRR